MPCVRMQAENETLSSRCCNLPCFVHFWLDLQQSLLCCRSLHLSLRSMTTPTTYMEERCMLWSSQTAVRGEDCKLQMSCCEASQEISTLLAAGLLLIHFRCVALSPSASFGILVSSPTIKISQLQLWFHGPGFGNIIVYDKSCSCSPLRSHCLSPLLATVLYHP